MWMTKLNFLGMIFSFLKILNTFIPPIGYLTLRRRYSRRSSGLLQKKLYSYLFHRFHYRLLPARTTTAIGVSIKTNAGKQSPRCCLETCIFFSSSVLLILDFIFSMHFFFAPPNFLDNSETFSSDSPSERSEGLLMESVVTLEDEKLSWDLYAESASEEDSESLCFLLSELILEIRFFVVTGFGDSQSAASCDWEDRRLLDDALRDDPAEALRQAPGDYHRGSLGG